MPRAWERALVPVGLLTVAAVVDQRRLGKLYDAKGDAANAIAHYQKFVTNFRFDRKVARLHLGPILDAFVRGAFACDSPLAPRACADEASRCPPPSRGRRVGARAYSRESLAVQASNESTRRYRGGTG
jgi:hypothetical protein